MESDFILFITCLMLVAVSFMIFPKLYFDKNNNKILFSIALLLAIVGLIGISLSVSTKPYFKLYFLCPLYSLTLLKVLLAIFQRIKKRNPKFAPRDTYYDDGLWSDRMFYFFFIICSILLPSLFLISNFA